MQLRFCHILQGWLQLRTFLQLKCPEWFRSPAAAAAAPAGRLLIQTWQLTSGVTQERQLTTALMTMETAA
jgi:hypothetical protein